MLDVTPFLKAGTTQQERDTMDRKSITGFLLIALVIILYPWYMSIVSPSIPNENNTDKKAEDDVNTKKEEQNQ